MTIINNRCSVMPNTNEDIYSGTFSMESSNDITFMYIISFKPGTKARGNMISDFKLFQLISGGKLMSIESSTAFYTKALEEVILGF